MVDPQQFGELMSDVKHIRGQVDSLHDKYDKMDVRVRDNTSKISRINGVFAVVGVTLTVVCGIITSAWDRMTS